MFFDTYFDNLQVLCVEITEKTKNRQKLPKTRPKTAQKPPYWQFGAFQNFYDTYFDY